MKLKLFLLLLQLLPVAAFSQGYMFFHGTVGYGLSREVEIPEAAFQSKNTICVDLQFGGFGDSGFGFSFGVGAQNVDFSNVPDEYYTFANPLDKRKLRWEISAGPLLKLGAPEDCDFIESPFAVILSARPNLWFAGTEYEAPKLSVGVKFGIDIRLSYITLGVSYNPVPMKVYVQTDDGTFNHSSYEHHYFKLKPMLEFRLGVVLAGCE